MSIPQDAYRAYFGINTVQTPLIDATDVRTTNLYVDYINSNHNSNYTYLTADLLPTTTTAIGYTGNPFGLVSATTGVFSGLKISNLTPSQTVITDANDNLASYLYSSGSTGLTGSYFLITNQNNTTTCNNFVSRSYS